MPGCHSESSCCSKSSVCTEPVRVCVTGAAGQIGYSLVYSIARGLMFGLSRPVELCLLDIPATAQVLEGVIFELQDCAFPTLSNVQAFTDPLEAFKELDVAILVGAMPRKQGMERAELLQLNKNIFKVQGEALDKVAKKTCKILVVGNPANTNCRIAMEYAKSIPRENFSALTRLDHNRAISQLAMKSGKSCSAVSKVAIWGNHSSTQYPDASHATIDGVLATKTLPIEWLHGDFISVVQKRGAAIIDRRKLSSAMSAANAIVDHIRDWFCGTNGRVVSMAICSDNNPYNVAGDLIFSFPVTCENGKWTIATGFDLDEFSRKMIDATTAELKDEIAQALA